MAPNFKGIARRRRIVKTSGLNLNFEQNGGSPKWTNLYMHNFLQNIEVVSDLYSIPIGLIYLKYY